MPVSDQVKSLTEKIEASYEARTEAVADIVKETQEMLGRFKQEHEQMIHDLRDFLISSRRAHEERARETAEFLSAATAERKEEAVKLRERMKEEIAKIESDTA